MSQVRVDMVPAIHRCPDPPSLQDCALGPGEGPMIHPARKWPETTTGPEGCGLPPQGTRDFLLLRRTEAGGTEIAFAEVKANDQLTLSPRTREYGVPP